MMKKDRSKLLLPCYCDMDPYDLPEALSVLQSYDMSKIGFIQDLIRGVKKVIDAGKPQESVKETVKETVVVRNEGGSNVQALLKRGNMALEDGEWSKADEFFEQVLNQDAECGAAYLGKFLARVECRSAKAYVDAFIGDAKTDAPSKKNAYACEEEEALVGSCVKKYAVPGILSGDAIREMLKFDLGYCKTSDYYALCAENAQKQFAADKDLMRAEKYASREAKTIIENIPQTLNKLRADAQKREDAEKARITADYRKFLTETEAKLEKEHPQRLKEAQTQEKAAAKAKKVTAIVLGAAATIIAVVLIVTRVIIPSVNYSKAEKLLAAGDYDGAITTFTALGDYKDATERKADARNAKAYADAETLLENGDYDGAIAAFTKLGEYQDAASRVKDAEAQKQETENAQAYQEALSLQESGDYEKAADAFAALGSYNDAADWQTECQYLQASQLQSEGETARATIAFGKIAGYKDAQEQSISLWDTIAVRTTLAAGVSHTAALNADGTVVAVGYNKSGQCDVSDWTDIAVISVGDSYTVGLKTDGTVVAVGCNKSGQCDVSGWTDILAISAGSGHTVGLKADGTVVAVGNNDNDQCAVTDWTDIAAISAGWFHTVGLKTDGTVVAVGSNKLGQCNVSRWTDIVAISAGGHHAVGLKADGTVVAVGDNRYGQCDVSDWTDIVAIGTGYSCTVGLKVDGTVVAVGSNYDGQCDVSNWTNIVAISTKISHTVGLKSDGTVIAVGDNYYGQCNVSGWTNIKLPD